MLYLIADDPDLDDWVADGIRTFEQLLALHAAFHRYLQRLRDAL
jgi:hypothetical protein